MSSSMQDLLKEILPPADGVERPPKLPDELRKADKATATSPEGKPEKTHRVKFFRRIFRFNKATSTQEDQQCPDASRPTVKGPDPKNMKGPSSRNILYVENTSYHAFMLYILYYLWQNIFIITYLSLYKAILNKLSSIFSVLTVPYRLANLPFLLWIGNTSTSSHTQSHVVHIDQAVRFIFPSGFFH